MKGTIDYLGRGLLVLALSGWVVGCGDDDSATDSGVDGGGGSGGTTGGSGGTTDGGGGGTGGSGGTDGGGSVSMAECVDMTNTNTGNMAADACVTCVCEKDVDATVACEAECWALISCVGAKCGGSATSGMCLTDPNKCGDEFTAATMSTGGTATATALGMVITMMCSTECVSTPMGDGGAEDGGT